MLGLLSQYETGRSVRIHSQFLGILYYSLVILVVCGQLGLVLYHRDYLEYDTPKGVIRLSLQPTPGLNEYEMVLPHPLDSDYVFITTAVTKKVERMKKGDTKGSWEQISETLEPVFTTENIGLKIEHTMFAPNFFSSDTEMAQLAHSEFVQSSRNLEGVLQTSVNNSRTIKQLPKGVADKLSIQDLLEAAGIFLDKPSGIFNHEHESIRDRGAVLHVSIIYSNVQEYSLLAKRNDIKYQYRVTRLPETGYKLTENTTPFDVSFKEDSKYQYRYLVRRYGLYIKFMQEGQLGRFSWSNLVLHVLSAVGLLGLMTILIDYFALYMIPNFMDAKYVVMKLATKTKKN